MLVYLSGVQGLRHEDGLGLLAGQKYTRTGILLPQPIPLQHAELRHAKEDGMCGSYGEGSRYRCRSFALVQASCQLRHTGKIPAWMIVPLFYFLLNSQAIKVLHVKGVPCLPSRRQQHWEDEQRDAAPAHPSLLLQEPRCCLKSHSLLPPRRYLGPLLQGRSDCP